MEKITSIKINNKGRIDKSRGTSRNIIPKEVQSAPYKDLVCYVDSKCIGFLNPPFLIDSLPKNLMQRQNVEALVSKNAELKKLLEKYNLNLRDNSYNSILSTNEHMKQTAILADKICDNIKARVNKARVVKAARLHDVGKIFIPSSILNKTDVLTKKERQIMNAHAELGHKLLETLKLDSKTSELIRNHHNYDKNSSIEQQIVSAADVYTALTEIRPYKEPLSKEQAFEITSQYGFSEDVMSALEKAIA